MQTLEAQVNRLVEQRAHPGADQGRGTRPSNYLRDKNNTQSLQSSRREHGRQRPRLPARPEQFAVEAQPDPDLTRLVHSLCSI